MELGGELTVALLSLLKSLRASRKSHLPKHVQGNLEKKQCVHVLAKLFELFGGRRLRTAGDIASVFNHFRGLGRGVIILRGSTLFALVLAGSSLGFLLVGNLVGSVVLILNVFAAGVLVVDGLGLSFVLLAVIRTGTLLGGLGVANRLNGGLVGAVGGDAGRLVTVDAGTSSLVAADVGNGRLVIGVGTSRLVAVAVVEISGPGNCLNHTACSSIVALNRKARRNRSPTFKTWAKELKSMASLFC
jgi:hypothetical protein